MPRSWILYVLTVAIPVSVGSVVAIGARSAALESADVEEDRKAAEIAIALLQLDLDRTTENLLGSASSLEDPDPESAAVAAALAGDTVAGLGVVERGMQATLFAPGPDGSILYAEEAFEPSFPTVLEGFAGYEAALYMNGIKRTTTDASFGPDTLGVELLQRLSRAPGGIAQSSAVRRGVLIPMESSPGRTPSVVVLAAPSQARTPAVASLRWSLGLALGFAVAALGWWALRAPDTKQALRPASELVTLLGVPLIVVWGGLAVLQTGYLRSFDRARAAPLVLASAVVRSFDEDASALHIREITGYETTILSAGDVTDAAPSPPDEETVDALIALVASGSRSGTFASDEGRVRFSAVSRPSGDVLLTTQDDPAGPLEGPGTRFLLIGLAVLIMVAWFAALRPRTYRSGPAS